MLDIIIFYVAQHINCFAHALSITILANYKLAISIAIDLAQNGLE